MPETPSVFLYSFLTMVIVGVILTSSFSIYVSFIKSKVEILKLKEIVNKVAAKVEEALLNAVENNATVHLEFTLPPKIGDRYYWIRIRSDSSKTWIEASFGRVINGTYPMYRTYLPNGINASGIFRSMHGRALIICFLNGTVPQLSLSRAE